MKSDKVTEWLKKFSEVSGVTGYEKRVKSLLIDRMKGLGDVSSDGLGSVVFRHKGTGSKLPKIMLAAHMDEVGFMVKHITKEGFLKFVCLGGWWEQVMLSQRVVVHSEKGDLVGVIGSKPPHILTAEERAKVVNQKDMFIDVGADSYKEVTEKLGIKVGDFVTPYCEFSLMGNEKYLLGKAWDNRVGCAIMADVMENLVKKGHENDLYAVGTVQEEVGLRGALTSSHMIMPDIGLVVETTVAGGMPGVTDDIAPAKLGDGVAIVIYDGSMIPNTALRDFAIETAKKEKIKHQVSFSAGGTDGGRIHMQGSGIPTLVLSIPTRYIHSHQSIIHRDDYDSSVKLLTSLVSKLDSSLVKQISER